MSLQSDDRFCFSCSKITEFSCSCKSINYCSVECQRSDRNRHKKYCKFRPTTKTSIEEICASRGGVYAMFAESYARSSLLKSFPDEIDISAKSIIIRIIDEFVNQKLMGCCLVASIITKEALGVINIYCTLVRGYGYLDIANGRLTHFWIELSGFTIDVGSLISSRVYRILNGRELPSISLHKNESDIPSNAEILYLMDEETVEEHNGLIAGYNAYMNGGIASYMNTVRSGKDFLIGICSRYGIRT